MKIGTRVYGLGAVALGVVGIAFPDFVVGQQLSPHHWGHDLLVYGGAAALILGGLALNLPRVAAMGAALLTAFLAFWVVVLNGPHLIAEPLVLVSWESICEMIALTVGAVIAWVAVSGGDAKRAAMLTRGGQLVFGLCLLVFGAAHFGYAKFTASMVPVWLPPGQMFWTYATGIAQAAAGLALLSGVQARLAAYLLTTMYAVFGLLVHTPHVIADPHSAGAWAEFSVNLALMGAAWTVADSLGSRPKR